MVSLSPFPLLANSGLDRKSFMNIRGIIPIYLSEISPPAFRAVFSGLAYQLGNAASSASAQIETTAGEHITKFARGAKRPDYGTMYVA